MTSKTSPSATRLAIAADPPHENTTRCPVSRSKRAAISMIDSFTAFGATTLRSAAVAVSGDIQAATATHNPPARRQAVYRKQKQSVARR
jgi:hypothetical protein